MEVLIMGFELDGEAEGVDKRESELLEREFLWSLE